MLNSQLPLSSPENVVTGVKGDLFYRSGNDFYLIHGTTRTKLSLPKRAFTLSYKNEIWYPTLKDDNISFSTSTELWVKNNSTGATGWTFLTNRPYDANVTTPTPTPTQSVTPTITPTPTVTPTSSVTPTPTPTPTPV